MPRDLGELVVLLAGRLFATGLTRAGAVAGRLLLAVGVLGRLLLLMVWWVIPVLTLRIRIRPAQTKLFLIWKRRTVMMVHILTIIRFLKQLKEILFCQTFNSRA